MTELRTIAMISAYLTREDHRAGKAAILRPVREGESVTALADAISGALRPRHPFAIVSTVSTPASADIAVERARLI